MQGRLQQLLQHPHASFAIIGIAMLLVLPSLAAGLFADDYAHLLRLLQPSLAPPKAYPGIADLFAFIHADETLRLQQKAYSLLPWWTSEQLQVVFFRPLAELSHWLDSRLWPQTPLLMHVQSLAWYGALLVALYGVYRRLMPNKVMALLALLFFAVDATHGFAVAWIANRNALMAGFFLLLGLMAFIDARHQKKKIYSALSTLWAACALLSAELAVSFIVFYFLYLVLLDKEQGLQKYQSLLPSLVLLSAWIAFYRWQGFGAKGSYYFDPLHQPLDFFLILPERFFSAFAMQFNVLPLHLMDQFPVAVTLIGVAIFVLWLSFVIASKSKHAAFFLAAFAGAVLPVSAVLMQERNLLVAGFAGCGLQAVLLFKLWQLKARRFQYLAHLLVIFHLVLSALMLPPMSFAPYVLNKQAEKTAQLLPALTHNQSVIALGAPFFSSVFLVLIRQWQGEVLPQSFWHLSQFEDVTIEPLATLQWRLYREQGLLHKEDFLLRDLKKNPFVIGESIDLDGASVIVEKINAQGVPTALILQLAPQHDAPVWIKWQGQQWQVLDSAYWHQHNHLGGNP